MDVTPEGRFRGTRRVIHAKSEQLNMTGSSKDRMALLVPNWMSRERMDLIRGFGATMVLISREEGGFLGSIDRAEAMARERSDVFLPRQFGNAANIEAHESSTGPEIWSQLQEHSLVPDAFVAGVGTGGTVMGVGRYLLRQNPRVRIHPLEPSESPTLSEGHRIGCHRIQGVSDEFIPPIVNLGELNEVIGVSDGDSILMARILASQLGLGVGISSGANFLGSLLVSDRMGSDAVVVTVFPDDNKKYLTTDLLRTEPVRKGYLAPEVELKGFATLDRTGKACCRPVSRGRYRAVSNKR